MRNCSEGYWVQGNSRDCSLINECFSMADRLSKQARSTLMSQIRTKGTAPEMRVRKALHSRGYRFRVCRPDLPGTPDIVLPRYRTCIFVNGCFWHGHRDCTKSSIPKTNFDYWHTKISRNKQRDINNYALLRKLGWNVMVIWECQTKSNSSLYKLLNRVGFKEKKKL